MFFCFFIKSKVHDLVFIRLNLRFNPSVFTENYEYSRVPDKNLRTMGLS